MQTGISVIHNIFMINTMINQKLVFTSFLSNDYDGIRRSCTYICIYSCCEHISSRCCCAADGTSSGILFFMLHQLNGSIACSKTVNIFTKTEFSIGFILILSYFHAMCSILLLYLCIYLLIMLKEEIIHLAAKWSEGDDSGRMESRGHYLVSLHSPEESATHHSSSQS